MKLLHVIASMDPRHGGPCQGIRNLAPQVLGAGHDVEIVCLDDPQAAYLQSETHRVHALGQGRTPWCYHPALLPWLKTNLPRFDAVILNGLWQYPGYALAKACRSLPNPPPYFVYPHGMLDPWFQRAPERRLKAIRNWFYWKLIERHVISQATAVFFTCAEELQLARQTFRPYAPQREINVGYGVAQPPPYHDRMAAAFAEKCPGLNGQPYLLFLSRIHPKKGIDLLIRAYAKVYGAKAESGKQTAEISTQQSAVSGEAKAESREQKSEIRDQRSEINSLSSVVCSLPTSDLRPLTSDPCTPNSQLSTFNSQLSPNPAPPAPGRGPESDATPQLLSPNSNLPTPVLVIAGPGLDTPYGREMQRLAAEVSSPWSVVRGPSAPPILFPGMLTGDAKWGALYGCEAFALPSHQENFGIAVVEALACGKPVLISNQVNIWREIETAGGGIVAADDLAGTEQVLRQWQALSAERRDKMGRAASDCYAAKFSVIRSGETFMATITQFLAEKPRTKNQPLR